MLVGHWLGLSSYRAIESFSIGRSLLVFSPSFVGALAAFILAPELPPDGRVDLSLHYRHIARWVFPLLALFMLLAGVSDRLVLGEDLFPPWLYGLRSGALIAPAFVEHPSVHVVALLLALASPLVYLAVSGQGL